MLCCFSLSSGRAAHGAEYQFWVIVSIPTFSNCDPVKSYLLWRGEMGQTVAQDSDQEGFKAVAHNILFNTCQQCPL